MRRLVRAASLVTIGIAASNSIARAGDWPQFRGVNAAGRAVGEQKLPTEIGPGANVVWKTPIPPGHSSPVIVGERIFLTGVRDEKLYTLALDRSSGKQVWETLAPHQKLEAIHNIGSHAQSSPAADGEVVISLFGSSGLFAYDRRGKQLWHVPMGPFKNDFGAGSSPILVDDRVILCQDHDTDSFLAAYDKRTGQRLWNTDRSEFTRSYCTPIIWEVNGKKQIVVSGTLRVAGYDFETGRELWTIRGIARFSGSTPVIGDDGTLFAASWGAGGDVGGEKITLDPFDDFAAACDKNGNGAFEEEELPDGPVKMRFTQIDRDKSGSITRQEYDYFRRLFAEGKNVVVAIVPGAVGEATETHLRWSYDRDVPFCASPVYADGRLFTIKDGGILTALDSRTGRLLKKGRLPGTGDYYCSPVVGDGKLYAANREGKLSVVSAVDNWQPLHTADFGEDIYASPALVDGRIYLRTVSALYCFSVTGN